METADKQYRIGSYSVGKAELRQAGLGLCIALAVLSIFAFYSGRMDRFQWLALAAAVVLALAVFVPLCILPFHFAVQKAMRGITIVSTYLMLGAVFYLVFTPVGIILRLIREDPLDRRMEKDRPSYWKTRESKPFDRSRAEKQF